MKKAYLAALPLLLAGACSDEIDTPDKDSNGNAAEGSEVVFSAKLGKTESSRTLYGGQETQNGKNVFPIFWTKNDTVLLASPQCSVQKATYLIGYDETNPKNYATGMTKIGAKGLQWGSSQEAAFYSVYPKSFTMEGKLYTNTLEIAEDPETKEQTARAELNIRNTQLVRFSYNSTDKAWSGISIDDDPQADEKIYYPDAVMYAQTYMNTQGDVALQYHPLTTAMHVLIPGYEYQYIGTDRTMTINEITIEAPAGTILCGKFSATFDPKCSEAPGITIPEAQDVENPNIIRVIPTETEDTKYLTVNEGENIEFNIFAIPNDFTVSENWKITLSTTRGTYTRTLTPSTAEGKSPFLKAGMIQNVELPQFAVISDFTFNLPQWMKNIPRNTYITALSLPGAWFSLQPEYQGTTTGVDKTGYDLTIHDLWTKGVRAFSVETRTSSYINWSNQNDPQNGTPQSVVISQGAGDYYPDGSDNPQTAFVSSGTSVSSLMSELVAELKSKQYGYGVLTLQYAEGGDGGHRDADYEFWLEGLYREYAALSQDDRNVIYGSLADDQPITAETTIDDVAGRLILQVNVAGGLPVVEGNTLDYIPVGNYQNNLPALFTYVNRKRTPGTSPVTEMHWKEWQETFRTHVFDHLDRDNIEEVTNALLSLYPKKLYCNYVVANRTYKPVSGSSNTDGLPTFADRKQAIERILRNSNILHQNNRTNMWLFAGAGGAAVQNSSGSSLDIEPMMEFAANMETTASGSVGMNTWLNEQIQKEIAEKTYSPFGMIYCNFIAQEDPKYLGQDIAKGLVKMNRLFRLPTRPESSEPKASRSALSRSTTTSCGNGWELTIIE